MKLKATTFLTWMRTDLDLSIRISQSPKLLKPNCSASYWLLQSSHALVYKDTTSQLETSPTAAKHPKVLVRLMKMEDAPHLTGISPLKIRHKSLCEKENIPMLSSLLVYRHSVLLLKCSTIDLVMVLEVNTLPELLQLDLNFPKIRVTPEFPDSLALYSWCDSYCYQFRLIWSLNPV